MGMAGMLVMWPTPFEQFFFLKGPVGCTWNLVAIGPVVSEEKSFEIVDGRRTDGRRTTEPAYTISSPGAFGSGELTICFCLVYKCQNAFWVLDLVFQNFQQQT